MTESENMYKLIVGKKITIEYDARGAFWLRSNIFTDPLNLNLVRASVGKRSDIIRKN